jgi:hypothetical protein
MGCMVSLLYAYVHVYTFSFWLIEREGIHVCMYVCVLVLSKKKY